MLTVVGSALSFTATKFVQMPTYPIPSIWADDGLLLLWRGHAPTARGSRGQIVLRNAVAPAAATVVAAAGIAAKTIDLDSRRTTTKQKNTSSGEIVTNQNTWRCGTK